MKKKGNKNTDWKNIIKEHNKGDKPLTCLRDFHLPKSLIYR